MSFQKTQLPNGVRILTESVDHVGSASIGVWCETGSRHELPSEAGITHFIEHMLFKGTPTRTSHQIAEAIEGRGGMLNAFTDKEQTCYYCRVLAEDSIFSLDILCDMVKNSLLDSEELEREKGVVLEEIKRGEDDPGDLVHDLHMQGLWPTHNLGLSVIGTSESVSSFSRDNLVNYIKRRYTGATIVVSAAGNINHNEFVDKVSQYFADLPPGDNQLTNDRPQPQPGTNLIGKEVEQVHFCIGGEGSSYYDESLYPMTVLDQILGGGMSSRLFQEVREKRGLVYAVGSYHPTYRDGGSFTIYGGTGMQTWEKTQEIIWDELKKIRDEGPTADEITRIKRQFAGNLVLGLESMSSRMMRQSRNEMIHGRQISPEETLEKVNAVTKDQIMDWCRTNLLPEKMRTTAIGPFKN